MRSSQALLHNSDLSAPARDKTATCEKSNLYILEQGHVFASSSIEITNRTRIYASINLTVDHSRIHLRVGNRAGRYQAAALGPGPTRTLKARGQPVLCFQILPLHPLFPHFSLIGAAVGVIALPREAFAHLDAALEAAFVGTLDVEDVAELHDAVTQTATRFLPAAKPIDPRVRTILQRLDDTDTPSLQDLSKAMGLSYSRMSHLFGESMGLSLRSYCLWNKLQKVRRIFDPEKSLTAIAQEAGFCDSAHFTKAHQDMYGASPSYFLRNNAIRLLASRRVRACPEEKT
ncbi:AraC family transcriptional regulator [Alkalilimnicola ehrlichii]|nr:AraC family transcriptional regulator [Alkalilimnicola ehrlichii]